MASLFENDHVGPTSSNTVGKTTLICPATHNDTGCRRARLVSTPSGWRWRICGSARCCRRCRDRWAWKRSSAIQQSVKAQKATHFVTLQPGEGMTPNAFYTAVGRFWKALKRPGRVPGGVEYLSVFEWVDAHPHVHGLVRVAGNLSRRAFRKAKRAAGVKGSVKPIRVQAAAVKYVFKNVKSRNAELPPAEFRGRIFSTSRGFLTKSWKALWEEYRDRRWPRCPTVATPCDVAEHTARPGVDSSNANDIVDTPAFTPDHHFGRPDSSRTSPPVVPPAHLPADADRVGQSIPGKCNRYVHAPAEANPFTDVARGDQFLAAGGPRVQDLAANQNTAAAVGDIEFVGSAT